MKIFTAFIVVTVFSTAGFSQEAPPVSREYLGSPPAAAAKEHSASPGGRSTESRETLPVSREYLGLPSASAKKLSASPAGRGAGFAVNKRHVVRKGETLWSISGKYYRDPFKWGKIYNANVSLVTNPDLIYPENGLEIPDITEEVRPAADSDVFIGSDETQKDPELTSSEIVREGPQDAASPARTATAAAFAPKAAALAVPGEELENFYKTDGLSDEMPSDQKEWNSDVVVAAAGWLSDGVVVGKADSMADSLSVSGETVLVKMRARGLLKKGDTLRAFLKGSPAYDKKGKKAGFELQHAGTLLITAADGLRASAVVTEASTSIEKGMLLKKK